MPYINLSRSSASLGAGVSAALAAAPNTSGGFLTYDVELAALGGLTSAADRLPYFTGSGTASLATFSATGRSLVDDASVTAMRITLGLTAGTANLTLGTLVCTSFQASVSCYGETLTVGGFGSAILHIISATATLDFGNIAAGTSADLTITVTGATVGSSVELGLPAAPNAAIVFTAWVSAADTVTVRAFNNNPITAVDPASGSYRVTVTVF